MTQSFRLVNERLEQVYKGLGEMQTLAAGVGDLKKVLSNVKTRGILGEIQLGSILREILAPEQYEVERNMADGDYETSFRLDWYRLSLPALAEPFARDLFSRHTFYAEIPERYTVAPLDVPDTDAVLITEEGGFGQDVLLCRGTVVFYLRYYGDQELSPHPELLAELAQFDGR